MVRRHYNLPSLNGLAAFEAAARHLSLTRAAGELNVTPGAVSKQVKLLEDDIGAKLFVRMHRALELTAEGQSLAECLKDTFEKIAENLAGLRGSTHLRSVSIGTTNAFAQLWLMPRLGQFWQRYPDIIIDHVISDRTQEFARSDVNLRVRYGNGVFPEEVSCRLFGDTIMAVASPVFLAQSGVTSLKDATKLALLSIEGVDWSWTNWTDFFRCAGLAPRRLNVRRFNSYVIALQAAEDSQGLVLGWTSQVAPLLASGKLAALTEFSMVAPHAFYLTWPERKSLSVESALLRDWLLEIVA